MKDILVTVGIVSMGDSAHLHNMLESLIPQLGDDTEVIIIEDRLSEVGNLSARLDEYPHISICYNDTFGVRYGAEQKIVELSRGRYILWLQDAIPEKHMLDVFRAEIMKKQQKIDLFHETSSFQQYIQKKEYQLRITEKNSFRSHFLQSIMLADALTRIPVLVKKSCYMKYLEKGKKTGIEPAEFWLQTVLKNSAWNIDHRLSNYKTHLNNPDKRSCIFRLNETSFQSQAIREVVKKTPLEELFPVLQWRDPKRALAQAISQITNGILWIGDVYNANRFFRTDLVPYLGLSSVEMYLHCALRLGKVVQSESILESAKCAQFFSRKDIESLHVLVHDVAKHQYNLMFTFRENRIKELGSEARKIINAVGSSLPVYQIYSERHEMALNRKRQMRCDLESLRYDPADDALFHRCLKNAESKREGEIITGIRKRLIGEKVNTPLYYLSCLRCPEKIYQGTTW